MYIKVVNNEHVLVRTIQGTDGKPREVDLANLGEDPELNLFLAGEKGRRDAPELWEGVHDFHLLQALENFKRRIGGYKPALVAFDGNKTPDETTEDEQEDE
jgi:hypothetical protein